MKTAMILAAGRGQRLRPLTDTTPKPLIKVGSRSLVEHHLLALKEAGFTEIVINLCHLGEKISKYLGDGERFGVKISYSWEPPGALETAGGIRHALELLDTDQFLVVNGDIRCDLAFENLTLPDESAMHLVLVPNPADHSEGDFSLDSAFSPARLCIQNPDRPTYTFSGIGIYKRSVFQGLLDRVQPLAPIIAQNIKHNLATAEIYQGHWFDIGTAERLAKAREAEPVQSIESH
jgi:MurNAc alpha-1-phosphate uridylyltransferase